MTEVTSGIVVANLPPLRKSFDSFFKHVLPSTGSNNILSRNKSGGPNFESFNLSTYRNQTARTTGDGGSDKAILEEIEIEQKHHDSKILKTTQISVGTAV
jgi:hypothetical protein